MDAQSAQTVILTPALTRELVKCCSSFAFSYLQLAQGSPYVPAVEREIERVVPAVLPYDFYDTALTTARPSMRSSPRRSRWPSSAPSRPSPRCSSAVS